MKRLILDFIKISLFIGLHVACAMQEYKHEPVQRRPSQAIDIVEQKIAVVDVDVQENERRHISDEREQVRYNHRRRLAILTLISSVVGGITTITYLVVKN